MRTSIIVLILGLTASSVMSACVGDNAYSALLTAADSAVTSTVLATAADIDTNFAQCGEYARTGTKTKVCATDFAKAAAALQKHLTTLEDTLEGLAGTRDKYINKQRGEVVKVLSSLKRINELSASNANVAIPTKNAAFAGKLIDYAGTIAKNFTEIVANFDDYQTSRATCMNALVQSQGALLCNALIEAPPATITNTKGSEAAKFDDAFVNQIYTACSSYFTNSVKQSTIILTAAYSSGIASMVSAIEKLINKDDAGAATDLASAWTAFGKVTFSTVSAEKPVEAGCTDKTTCLAFIDTFFDTKGLLQNDVVILGGKVPTNTFTRILKGEGNERRLAATGGLVADLSKYTFTTSFEKNPGKVDNKVNANSALRNGIVACAVAALALVF